MGRAHAEPFIGGHDDDPAISGKPPEHDVVVTGARCALLDGSTLRVASLCGRERPHELERSPRWQREGRETL
jgi:hypothetical protein